MSISRSFHLSDSKLATFPPSSPAPGVREPLRSAGRDGSRKLVQGHPEKEELRAEGSGAERPEMVPRNSNMGHFMGSRSREGPGERRGLPTRTLPLELHHTAEQTE